MSVTAKIFPVKEGRREDITRWSAEELDIVPLSMVHSRKRMLSCVPTLLPPLCTGPGCYKFIMERQEVFVER